jgi:hypothetical protein
VVQIRHNLGTDMLQQYGNRGLNGLTIANLVAFLDFLPPYIGARLNGQPSPFSHTEEVVGSSPIPPTEEPLIVGALAFIKPLYRCMRRLWLLQGWFHLQPFAPNCIRKRRATIGFFSIALGWA